MPVSQLLFIGYRNFTSKKGTKCFVLEFITEPKISNDGLNAYSSNVTIFTDESKYTDFIKSHDLLSVCDVNYEVVGDKVRYTI